MQLKRIKHETIDTATIGSQVRTIWRLVLECGHTVTVSTQPGLRARCELCPAEEAPHKGVCVGCETYKTLQQDGMCDRCYRREHQIQTSAHTRMTKLDNEVLRARQALKPLDDKVRKQHKLRCIDRRRWWR